ncbi:hypothetical protein PTHTG4_27340 [Parageobacillus thermoglucosidasius]|uniref:phage tail terminator family protein n=1 Tax=Parageobacillus thermoglucosidasius TaxID=1426 RepID=UPI000F61A752|nr:hypothetical protein [Parageobacillus thermoglucosidasius]GCD83670.1 hypothetical protein PTHTG4_27340 [Parageobacillus thermoglucosidasius]
MMTALRNAIISKLKTVFPDHKIYGEKVEQGLKKPCFFITVLPGDFIDLGKSMQQREITIDIQYLSKEETNAKNIEMADLLNDLFQKITFDGLTVNVIERRFEIVDDILHFFLDLDIILMLKDTEQYDLMQEIIHKEVL